FNTPSSIVTAPFLPLLLLVRLGASVNVYDGRDDRLFISRDLSAAREKGDNRRTTQLPLSTRPFRLPVNEDTVVNITPRPSLVPSL
ncbi:hypothetical protein PRIPAC_83253, partial [Pristionchus pacificus]